MRLCVSVCLCVCVSVFLQITRKEIVVNENNSDKFDIVHCGTKVKVFFSIYCNTIFQVP